jgi:hypothetical protein
MSDMKVVIEEINDPELAAKLKAQDEKFSRNLAVFKAHAQELFTQHRGKVIVIAGEELHVADTAEEAWAWAKITHPDDEGVFVHSIPREKGWRIYANHR